MKVIYMKMKNKMLKKILPVIIICVMVMGSSVMAYAYSTYSDWENKTVYGISYDYRAATYERFLTTGNTLEAMADIKTTNNINVPAGYIAAQTFLYDEYNNSPAYNPTMVYNYSSTTEHIVSSPRISTSGNYRSQIFAMFYDGDDYVLAISKKTPFASITNGNTNAEETDVNPEGHTNIEEDDIKAAWDSIEPGLVDVDELPEFIPVVAKDGTTGYIKTKDVIKIPKTIEEALKMTENAYADQVLPLYNRDGEVIGEIVNSYGDTEEMGLEFKASSSD